METDEPEVLPGAVVQSNSASVKVAAEDIIL